jgi:hypothetical protein
MNKPEKIKTLEQPDHAPLRQREREDERASAAPDSLDGETSPAATTVREQYAPPSTLSPNTSEPALLQ